MNQNPGPSRAVAALTGLALTVALAQIALAAPPPHAPAHGYRDKKGNPPPKSAPIKRAPRNANDLDGDGVPNTRDRDMDGDGIPNNRDRQPKVPNKKPLPKGAMTGHPVWNKLKNRGDDHRDPKKHVRKGDIDKDGIANRKDKDIDGDGIRNKKDKDRDGDRVPNKKDDFDRRKNRK